MDKLALSKLVGSARKLAVFSFLFFLASCVTTETGGFSQKADKQKAVESSNQLARQYIAEKEWDRAKHHLKNALELDEDNADIHEAMAIVFQNTGELERADKHYRQAIDADPSVSRIRLNYATYLIRDSRCDEAIGQLEVVVQDTLYGQRERAYQNMGYCYRILGDYVEAESNYKRAYLMSRKRSPVLLIELASVYYELEEYAVSQRYYDKFRANVKQQPPRGLLLGARLAKVFENDDAIASYGLALKNLYPTSQAYLDYKKEFGHDN